MTTTARIKPAVKAKALPRPKKPKALPDQLYVDTVRRVISGIANLVWSKEHVGQEKNKDILVKYLTERWLDKNGRKPERLAPELRYIDDTNLKVHGEKNHTLGAIFGEIVYFSTLASELAIRVELDLTGIDEQNTAEYREWVEEEGEERPDGGFMADTADFVFALYCLITHTYCDVASELVAQSYDSTNLVTRGEYAPVE